MIRVRYFASLRERLGVAGEEIDVSLLDASSVAGVLTLLCARGGLWLEVLGDDRSVLMALNQEMARPQSAVSDGDEVAFFPPVTGG